MKNTITKINQYKDAIIFLTTQELEARSEGNTDAEYCHRKQREIFERMLNKEIIKRDDADTSLPIVRAEDIFGDSATYIYQ